MLRSWRERLLVGLSPAELALVRLRGMLRPKIASKRALACDPAFGTESWEGAAAVLRNAVEGLRGEPLDVTVVLSNHFVRYALVPWNDALSSPEEEMAFARHCFARIHGERAKTWAVRLSEGPADAPRLASAIDAALLDAIVGCFPKPGNARLVSVQPYLMAVFNHWGTAKAAHGAWLLIVEEERACIALCEKDRWQAVLNAKGSFGAPEEWGTLLDRERHRVAHGEAIGTVLVQAAHGAVVRSPQAGNWKFERLTLSPVDGYQPLEDGRYTMALAAVRA